MITFYNGEYLTKLLRSIYKLQFKKIENLFIDDCSRDNEFKLLNNNYQLNKRIKNTNDNNNKGYSRYFRSRGKLYVVYR